jgi:hypothetical protein
MPSVGFEPTILVFERVKTVHALDRAATVIGPDMCRDQFAIRINYSFKQYRKILFVVVL